jgi:type I restriction enzyme, S subunit
MQTLKLTKKYETYPEYKDSGVEWLGKIPKDWKFKKLKSFFSLSNERVADNPDVTTILSVSGYRGVEIRKNTETFDGQMPSENVDMYRVVRKDQLVANTMWLNFTGLGVSKYEGYVSPAYRSYNISKEMVPEFVNHLMRSDTYVQKYSSLLYGLRPNSLQVKPYDFEKIEILYPNINEQKRISEYLDTKTSSIDQIIERKEKLIEFLREKRAAQIKNIIKSFDVEGREYTKEKIKHVVKSIESGVWGENPLGNVDDIKCLRVADFDYANLGFSNVETIRNNEKLSKRKILQRGDILIEKSGGGEKTPVGRAILFNSDERMVCANFVDVVRVDINKILPDFLVFYLSILYSERINTKYIKQNTGIQNMDIKAYFGEIVSFPDLKIQKEIVDDIKKKMALFDQSIKKVEETIEFLKEFKASLISNTVTGKIKV